MAGTLTISSLSDGTNTGSVTDAIKGSAKAWVNFNGVTTATIRASYNVSSVTRNGTGDYIISFANAMPDANYCANVSCESDATWPTEIRDSSFIYNSAAVGSIRVRTGKTPTSYMDLPAVYVTIFR